MDEFKHITLPLTPAQARELKVGEQVIVDGVTPISIGLPAHARILEWLDEGKELPIEMKGKSLFHLGFNAREENGRLVPLYINPTTSTRFNGYMPALIRASVLPQSQAKVGWARESVAR